MEQSGKLSFTWTGLIRLEACTGDIGKQCRPKSDTDQGGYAVPFAKLLPFNYIALRTAKTVWSFGHFECNIGLRIIVVHGHHQQKFKRNTPCSVRR